MGETSIMKTLVFPTLILFSLELHLTVGGKRCQVVGTGTQSGVHAQSVDDGHFMFIYEVEY